MDTEELKESAVSYELANGILHGEILNSKQYQTHMPISLFPFVVRCLSLLFLVVAEE